MNNIPENVREKVLFQDGNIINKQVRLNCIGWSMLPRGMRGCFYLKTTEKDEHFYHPNSKSRLILKSHNQSWNYMCSSTILSKLLKN